MQHCPKCSSERIHHSRSRTTWERWRKQITGKRPFRCSQCGWRGWGIDTGPSFSDVQRQLAKQMYGLEPPNLERTGLSRGSDRHDVRVEDLDAAGAAGTGGQQG